MRSIYFLVITFLTCHICQAQFYVAGNTHMTLKDNNTVLSVKTQRLVLNGETKGNGTLQLTGKAQHIESAKEKISLPHLKINEADNVVIDADLEIKNKITINKGILVLTHHLHVKDAAAIMLTSDAQLLETPTGQVYYDDQLSERPLDPIVFNTDTYNFNTIANQKQVSPFAITTTIAINTAIQIIDYNAYNLNTSPPPEKTVVA